MSIYPGDPPYSCCPALTIDKDGCNVQTISLSSHSGTHIDSPFHFFKSGHTVDEIPLDRFIGPAMVIDLTNLTQRQPITWDLLSPYEQALHQAANRKAILLLRTDWSRHWGTDLYFSHPYLDKHAAQRITDIGFRFVGIDALSPDETHVSVSPPPPQDESCNPASESELQTVSELQGDGGDNTGGYPAHNVILGSGGLIAENLNNLSAIQSGEWFVSLVPLKLAGSDGSPVRAYAYRCTPQS